MNMKRFRKLLSPLNYNGHEKFKFCQKLKPEYPYVCSGNMFAIPYMFGFDSMKYSERTSRGRIVTTYPQFNSREP